MARPYRRPGEPELREGVRLLDRYSILDRIGSGGMATIYRATDHRLDRIVCVKLLRTTIVEGSGSTGGDRAAYQATYAHFLKEALALSRLQHPNTLRIYDFGYLEDDEAPSARHGEGAAKTPFHVSEYLDGGHLESHVRSRGPLPAPEALEILDGISGALAEAHEHGIIHRDVTPSNILFARVRGELVPKLADFGIAHSDVKKRASGAPPESVSTVALFSPRWAAPEQLCGSPEGPRTDVYALGLLTVYMLTGAVLFGDDDVRVTFTERVHGDALVGGRLASLGLSGELGRVLTMALRARSEERVASAPELAAGVRQALSSAYAMSTAPSPIVGPPASPAPSAARPGALEIERTNSEAGRSAPPERVVAQGDWRLRTVHVHERLDVSLVDASGDKVRFRITMLPGPRTTVNVKGLSCFVAKRGGRPAPAVTVTSDTAIDLISSARQHLGEVSLSLGQPSPNGRLFVVGGRHVLIPYEEAQQAVVLTITGEKDILAMCRS